MLPVPLCLAPSTSKVNTLFHQIIVILFLKNVSIPSQSISLYHFYYVFYSNRLFISTHDALSLPHIHLIILISTRCNASSSSHFKDHASLPCNIQLGTHMRNKHVLAVNSDNIVPPTRKHTFIDRRYNLIAFVVVRSTQILPD